MRISLHDARKLNLIINDFPVRFVGNQEDLTAEFSPLLGQNRRKTPDRLLVENLSRRVVRRVDQNRLCLLRYRFPDLIEIEGKIFSRRDDPRDTPRVVRIEAVLDKKRRRHDHLISRIQYRFQNDVQRPAGTAGHHDLIGRQRDPVGFTYLLGDGRAGFRVAGIRHVHVFAGDVGLRQFNDTGFHRLGRLEIGVAEAEIEDVFRPVLPLQTEPFLEHLPNEGGLRHESVDFFCDRHKTPFRCFRS